MERFKCYDIASQVLDEATKQFSELKENPQRRIEVESLCEKIDAFIATVDAEGFSVEVNPATTEIYLSVSCPEFVIEEMNHDLYDILTSITHFYVKNSDGLEYNIELRFVTLGIWHPA